VFMQSCHDPNPSDTHVLKDCFVVFVLFMGSKVIEIQCLTFVVTIVQDGDSIDPLRRKDSECCIQHVRLSKNYLNV
jgi:hypothetical protein